MFDTMRRRGLVEAEMGGPIVGSMDIEERDNLADVGAIEEEGEEIRGTGEEVGELADADSGEA